MSLTGSGYFLYPNDGTELVLAKGDEAAGLTVLDTFAYAFEPGVYYTGPVRSHG